MTRLKRGQRLYKFFDHLEFAHAMMRGSLRFATLAHFRFIEDQQIRGDRNEGRTAYQPTKGLLVTKEGADKPILLRGYRVESDTRINEIFVYCLSKSETERMQRGFNAVACVEITDVPVSPVGGSTN